MHVWRNPDYSCKRIWLFQLCCFPHTHAGNISASTKRRSHSPAQEVVTLATPTPAFVTYHAGNLVILELTNV